VPAARQAAHFVMFSVAAEQQHISDYFYGGPCINYTYLESISCAGTNVQTLNYEDYQFFSILLVSLSLDLQ